jgi:peptidoglycan/xylan/chitin deacetylase (PgdA/CDA1 family)
LSGYIANYWIRPKSLSGPDGKKVLTMSIPVLTYHHVSPCSDLSLNVSPDVFERQMRYLTGKGYRTLTMDELILYCQGKLDLDGKAVVLTFDDGWLDNRTFALPVLRKYGLKAALFIITGMVEKESRSPHTGGYDENYARLSWDNIKEMTATGLVKIYSHTKTHRNCKELSMAELKEELEGSKKAIEEMLNTPCPYLCLPYGRFNRVTTEAAIEAGYVAMLTTVPGVVGRGSNPLAINRIGATDGLLRFRLSMLLCTSPNLSKFYFNVRSVLKMLYRNIISFRPRHPNPQEP